MTNLFRIPVKIEKNYLQIKYEDQIMLFGSCFSQNIGDKLNSYKFNVFINPFGILYNPKSIYKNLIALIENNTPKESDFIKNNGIYYSWNHHGCYSSESKSELKNDINKQFLLAKKKLEKTKFLIITFGTSWIYKLIDSEKIVANCHKIPSDKFERLRLSTKEIIKDYEHLINKLKEFNPDLKIIFTVSPIRHLKDGAHENQLSKSSLLLSIDSLIKEFENCYYFPSYEIMVDELRDYRFYDKDMIHPSSIAIDYIWDKFKFGFISNQCSDLMNQIKKLRDAINHKPINVTSKNHIIFRKKFLEFATTLSKQNPFLDLKEEIDFFR